MLGPFWVAILAMMSAGIVDTIYLGHLSTNALAAVGFCFPIVFVGNSVNIGLSAGTMSAISRAIGRKDRVMSQNLGASAFLLSLCVISVLYVVGGAFAPNVLTLMGATQEIKPLSLGYLKYALPGLIVMGLAMMANNILRASGEAMLPSAIMISAAVFNIIIDPFLIFGIGPFPRMEVEGAALATLIANTIGMVFGFFVVFHMRKAASFASLNIERLISYWRAILRVGFPAIWTNVIVPFSGLAATAIVARTLGTTEVAAFTVVSRVGMLALTLLYALSACIGAITGQNGGAGLTERVRATFVFCFKICVAWGLLVGAVLGIFAHTIPWVFTQDAEVVRLALPYFYIVPFTFASYGFVFVSAAGFNALGRPRYGLIFTIIRSVILFVPFIWIGVALFGMTGVFLGIASSNIVSGIIAVYYTLKHAPMTVHEK
jgi:putative MATE family efflux protein